MYSQARLWLPTLLVATATLTTPAWAQEPDDSVIPKTLDDEIPAASETAHDAKEDDAGEVAQATDALPSAEQVLDRLAPKGRTTAEVTEDASDARVADAPARTTPSHVNPPHVTTDLVQRLIHEVRDVDLRPSLDLDPDPVVRNPRWPEVWSLVAEDECTKARALAGELVGERSSEPELSLVLARIELCANKRAKKRGRATLTTLAKRDDTLGYAAKRLLGQSVTPIPAPEHVTRGSIGLKARLTHAKTLAKTDLDAALATLDALAGEAHSGWSWYRVRKVEAELLEANGRVEDASQVWLAIYLRARDWKSGSTIEGRVEDFEKRHDLTVLGTAERVDRMRELIFKGRFKQARKLSEYNTKRLNINKKQAKGWTLYRKAVEDEQRRERERAVERFAQAEEIVVDPALRARVYFDWARALRRIHRDDEAIALYDRLCQEYAADTLCPEARYQAGRLLQYANRHQEALTRFYWLVALHPESSHVPDGLWRAAFSSYLSGDFAGAEPMLERIIAYHPRVKDASELTIGLKARYWLGVMALKQGDDVRAIRLLQDAIDHGPLTWYGRLATARMESLGATARVTLPLSRLTSEDLANLELLRVPDDPRLAPAALMARLGLWSDARDEVRRQLKRYPAPEGAERMLAALYLADDRPDKAHWIMKKHIDPKGPTYATLRDWGTAFPLHYMELAHQWGETAGVSPFLVQAIIRQESGFRTEAKSPVGALGLMQLMPRTASYVARIFLGEPKQLKTKQIFDPERNVKLGAMYIRMHTAYASDRVPLALAGYNAGPANLKRWYREYGERELDAWVESITYREARGYVRKVFTSYTTYAALYGNALPDVTIEMPANLRSWGDVPNMDRIKKGALIARALDERGVATLD